MKKEVYTGCCGSTEEQSGLLLEEVEMGWKWDQSFLGRNETMRILKAQRELAGHEQRNRNYKYSLK